MPELSRRTQLADAAIATLAREGSRGLTHRAVDRTAGLAQGSTSYYFRTRRSLLDAVGTRLAELDAATLPARPGGGVADLVELLASSTEDLIANAGDRQLARFELYLMAARRPELRASLRASAIAIRRLMIDQLRAGGVPEPEARAAAVLSLIDGQLFDRGTGVSTHAMAPPELRQALRLLLDAP